MADRVDRLTTEDLDRSEAHTLLVPLGATEQHGPHLPTGTDTIIALRWAEAIANRLPDTLVAPPLPYGSSGEHQAFAGTLSIGQDALRTILIELARSAAHRFRRVVFVSGHGGNAQPLREAVAQLQAEGHRAEGLLPVIEGADAHAGHTETSLLLWLESQSVRSDRLQVGNTRPLGELMGELRRGGLAAVTDNGILGDPRSASAELGERFFATLTNQAVAQLTEVPSDGSGADC